MVSENNSSPEHLVTPESLFKPARWLAKIDFIKQLVLSNNVLLTVLAEHDGGKTTFTKLLTQEIDTAIQVHGFQASSSFSNSDLIADLGNIFHKEVDSSTTMTNMIEHINQLNEHFLLVIDDAQNVPPVFLQELLMDIKRRESSIFFHVCLVSDFKILEPLHKLESEQFDNLIHTMELDALTEWETSTWLLNKSNGASHINNRRLREFYQLTGGSVARINSQMTVFVESLFSAPQSKFKKSIFLRLGQSISVVFVVSIVTWLWQTNYYSVPIQNADVKTTEPVKAIELTVVEVPLKSHIPAAYSTASMIQVLEPSSRNLVIDSGGSDEMDLNKMVVMDKVLVLPKIILAYPFNESTTLVSELPGIGALASKKILPEIKIVKKDRALYTIQLLASKQHREIEKFMAAHHTNGPFKIGYVKRQGKGWYVLTMGEFKKCEHAQRAIDSLSADIAQFKPWVRSAREFTVVG